MTSNALAPDMTDIFSRPIANSYVVPESQLAAGEYPGNTPTSPDGSRRAKLACFLDTGIDVFIDLTQPADGLTPYESALNELANDRGQEVWVETLPVRDMDACSPAHMRRVLDAIDSHLAAGRRVYVHCWGGVGRTGMAIGCWLVRHGRDGDDALSDVQSLFETMSPDKVARHSWCGSPQTEPQRSMVRSWSSHETPRGGAAE